MSTGEPKLSPPPARRLRVYAFDPHAALELASAKISYATVSLPWDDPVDGALEPGPINDYLEVIDVDPTSGQFYAPIDLNAPEVLAQDGLPPSEGDPRFHQQMVFAVVMKTIKQFERALGRKVLWRPDWDVTKKTYIPTQKLRVYPHALREANAYYSREKRALLFGYFKSTQRSAGANWIFTALSHDIIVHETTHAILDGLHRRYAEATSPDSLAFHEAFADIAALFTHFQLSEAVYDFIARNGGRLDQSGLLSGLASQFAKGTTGRKTLRDAISPNGEPATLEGALEAHDRGAILVAAVFDAFLSIYSARTADLLRMSGISLGQGGQLHPDLVARLTKEATKSADHVLRMCIRALDYLPPVDVRFGEFLRGIITADTDLIPDDRMNYRLAFVEAFRRRGIYPDNCLSMSPDNLLWEQPDDESLCTDDIVDANLNLVPEYDRAQIAKTAEENRRKVWYWLIQPEVTVNGDRNSDETKALRRLLSAVRAEVTDDASGGAESSAVEAMIARFQPDLQKLKIDASDVRAVMHGDFESAIRRWVGLFKGLDSAKNPLVFDDEVDKAWERVLGVYFQRRGSTPHTIGDSDELPVEVHSVRTTRRAGPDGQDIRQLVIEVTQRRHGYFDADDQKKADREPDAFPKTKTGDPDYRPPDTFYFRGGATMIIDLRDGKLRYVIRKSIVDDTRLAEQREYLLTASDMSFTYNHGIAKEPFALLHRH